MFAGLDDIDWAAMKHAYGPATEIPQLVRGLVDPDPAVREEALDAMYGAVHHQGDVYECTVKVIPFLLEAIANRTLPGRGPIVSLLASIGGGDSDDVTYDDFDADEFDDDDLDVTMYYGSARRAVAAAAPLLLELLTDDDPEVRQAVPEALLACRDDAGSVVSALQRRFADERDEAVQRAIIGVVGTFGQRAAAGVVSGVDVAAIGGWLAGAAAEHPEPAVRLAAMTEVARIAPDRCDSATVASAVDFLRVGYAAPPQSMAPAGFSTDTLTGHLRELWKRELGNRRAPQARDLVHQLSNALADRVTDRVALLTALLREPVWEARYDAVYPAGNLMRGWRGDYDELVRLIGQQLADPEPRLAGAAASVLSHNAELAGAAADALADSLTVVPRQGAHSDGLPPWVVEWAHGLPTIGNTLQTLATVRDPRALPALRWALTLPEMPRDLGQVVGHFGPDAADLVPTIRQRLRDLPQVDDDSRCSGLGYALGQIGEAAADAVPELVELLPAQYAIVALGRIGPAAAEAVPSLRRLCDHSEPSVAIPAATALYRITSDPGPVLPVLLKHLDGTPAGSRQAVEALGELGPAAAPAAPTLRGFLQSDDPYHWPQVNAAHTLWRATGDPDGLVPVLSAAWSGNPYTRTVVAGCVAEMGAAAVDMAPLLRAELASPRRNLHRDDRSWSTDDLRADLELITTCQRALAAMTG